MSKVLSQELMSRYPKDAFNWLTQHPVVDRWILRMDCVCSHKIAYVLENTHRLWRPRGSPYEKY